MTHFTTIKARILPNPWASVTMIKMRFTIVWHGHMEGGCPQPPPE